MALERYNKKEPQIFLWVILPYIIILNLLLFSSCIFSSFLTFAKSSLVIGVYLFVVYFFFGTVAIFIRARFPADSALFKRIAVMLPVFYSLYLFMFYGIYLLYANLSIIDCAIKMNNFWWAFLFGCVMSTTLTLLNEGAANWEKWKGSIAETERLRNVYQQSRLIGLKGQVNSHFLFNCFNTLSGLITEDEKNAEHFLEEMTKVHRYLLHSDNEILVSVADELKFAKSYLHLIKVRFGSGIIIQINVQEKAAERMIPPLSMQVILENIVYSNAITKTDPLQLNIESTDAQVLRITHSLHERKAVISFDLYEGLDNLLKKYKLLNAPKVAIYEKQGYRTIELPLLQSTIALV